MSNTVSVPGGVSAIEADMPYLIDTGELPVFYQSNVSGERTRFVGERETHRMTVHNGRLLAHTFALDVEGFAFVGHRSAVGDFYDNDELASVYNPEVEALLKAQSGASRVYVFDHTRRSSSQAIREANNSRDPAGVAHTDYTTWSAENRVSDVMGDAAPALLGKRFAIVNVWRPINPGPVEEWPLALCDARSVDDGRLHTVERRAYNRVGQTRHASYDADNRWIWFPGMTRDEAILIKNYDSATDGRARYALHTAFVDPRSDADATPRESIETRAFAFYDD